MQAGKKRRTLNEDWRGKGEKDALKTTEPPQGERSLDFGSRRITNEKRAPHFPGGEGRVRLNGREEAEVGRKRKRGGKEGASLQQ